MDGAWALQCLAPPDPDRFCRTPTCRTKHAWRWPARSARRRTARRTCGTSQSSAALRPTVRDCHGSSRAECVERTPSTQCGPPTQCGAAGTSRWCTPAGDGAVDHLNTGEADAIMRGMMVATRRASQFVSSASLESTPSIGASSTQRSRGGMLPATTRAGCGGATEALLLLHAVPCCTVWTAGVVLDADDDALPPDSAVFTQHRAQLELEKAKSPPVAKPVMEEVRAPATPPTSVRRTRQSATAAAPSHALNTRHLAPPHLSRTRHVGARAGRPPAGPGADVVAV